MKAKNAYQPIGIFDSGIGGLTVTNAIVKELPNEEIVYFGDTSHVPYGEKSPDAIRYYCLRIAKFLLEQNCKLIIVACNSASTVGYKVLTDFFKGQAHFISVVDPLVEVVASKNYKKVGIIATKATTQSKVYPKQLKKLQPSLEVSDLATPLLGPMIEEGFVSGQISETILNNYLSDERFEGIDAMLLACTHYPLIKESINHFFNEKVDIMDSTEVVAMAVRKLLSDHNLLNPKKKNNHRFYVSDYTPSFEATTQQFYQTSVHLEHCPLWQTD